MQANIHQDLTRLQSGKCSTMLCIEPSSQRVTRHFKPADDGDRARYEAVREALAETFLQDCDPEIKRAAVDRTARQSLAVLGQPVKSAAWQHVPSTYLVCAKDQGTPAELQREFAGRAGSVVPTYIVES